MYTSPLRSSSHSTLSSRSRICTLPPAKSAVLTWASSAGVSSRYSDSPDQIAEEARIVTCTLDNGFNSYILCLPKGHKSAQHKDRREKQSIHNNEGTPIITHSGSHSPHSTKAPAEWVLSTSVAAAHVRWVPYNL